jgi:hypothetical protein
VGMKECLRQPMLVRTGQLEIRDMVVKTNKKNCPVSDKRHSQTVTAPQENF